MMEQIQEQFNKVIKFSQVGIDAPKTNLLFKNWRSAKEDIYIALGEQLIYELPDPVTFELSEQDKEKRIDSFISSLWADGYDDLGRFLERQHDGFFSNKVIEEYIAPDEKHTKITKDTKIIKAFKYFIKDKELLNSLQDKASQIIQENKITGKLCFSIHPLDYLSISENSYNWRSCHALDGEYRAGNLSYMVDRSTIVCYLKGEDEVKLPNFPEDVLWNSKKWRVLIYLSNDWRMVFAGKQYPFSNDTGMKFIQKVLDMKFLSSPFDDWYSKPSNRAYWTEWTDYTVSDIPEEANKNNIYFSFDYEYIPVKNSLRPLHKLVKDVDGSKHFNDVLKSSCYKPMYCYLANFNSWSENSSVYANRNTKFEIGGMTYCLRCGNAEVMDSSSTMMCYDCELTYGNSENDCFCFCAQCGERMLTENGHWVDDNTYCQECFDKFTTYCADCGDVHRTEDMCYSEKDEEYYCSWCYRNRE